MEKHSEYTLRKGETLCYSFDYSRIEKKGYKTLDELFNEVGKELKSGEIYIGIAYYIDKKEIAKQVVDGLEADMTAAFQCRYDIDEEDEVYVATDVKDEICSILASKSVFPCNNISQWFALYDIEKKEMSSII